ncbi:MAG: hypothetical protein ACI90V_010840 [Bacillariaceae sp.]|jgi:hypothetical protein
MRHVEMKHSIILQWTDDKFIDFVDTSTDENYSDSLSKPTERTKFTKIHNVSSWEGKNWPIQLILIILNQKHT